MQIENKRFEQGMEQLAAIDGAGGENIIRSLESIYIQSPFWLRLEKALPCPGQWDFSCLHSLPRWPR